MYEGLPAGRRFVPVVRLEVLNDEGLHDGAEAGVAVEARLE